MADVIGVLDESMCALVAWLEGRVLHRKLLTCSFFANAKKIYIDLLFPIKKGPVSFGSTYALLVYERCIKRIVGRINIKHIMQEMLLQYT